MTALPGIIQKCEKGKIRELLTGLDYTGPLWRGFKAGIGRSALATPETAGPDLAGLDPKGGSLPPRAGGGSKGGE